MVGGLVLDSCLFNELGIQSNFDLKWSGDDAASYDQEFINGV